MTQRVVLSLLILLPCLGALGQSGAGTIQGTVTDKDGGAIPGASIHVVNTATGVATDTKSNGVGFYQAPDLFAGTYDESVSAPGMQTYNTRIELLVGQNAVINPVMIVGALTQQITVDSKDVQLVTTDNGAIASTLENARINQLPMNGRSFLTLTGETSPGLENGGQQVNGLSAAALEYTIDGVTTTQVLNGGEHNGAAQLVDPDSIQEISLQLNGSGAQFATPATGIVTTKSGTNNLHGTLFETARNNALGISIVRQDPYPYSAPHYVRNEFGVSAGGPIIIPHLYNGKNKSFWFFAYERYSLATSAATEASVPTAAMRQGDFSGLVNSANVLQTIYDPATTTNSASCGTTGKANAFCRTAFPGNKIPIGEISPFAKLYYQLVPQPTSSANPLIANNLNLLSPSYQVIPQETVRLDQAFNQNNRAYLRYTQVINATDTAETVPNVAVGNIPAGAASGYTNSPTKSYIASLGYTHVFSPTFFSETIISQQWFNTTYVTGTAANVDYESMLGLPNNFGTPGFPKIANLISNLNGSQNPDESSQIISTIDENLNKTVGRHQILFGGRYRHLRELDLPQQTNDTINNSALATALYNTTSAANYTATANTGYADASFFLGSASTFTVNQENPRARYHVMEFDPYIQDNYHVNKSLTLNFGLRYEAHPNIAFNSGLANTFDLKNDAVVLSAPPATLISEGYTTQAIITNDQNIGVKFETPSQAGLSNTLLRNFYLEFLPRFGFAYQPFNGRSGTVLRGGYGRYVYPVNYSSWANQQIKNNPLVASYAQSYTAANQAVDGLPNELIRYNAPAKFGVLGANTASVVNSNSTNSILPGITNYGMDPDREPPIVTEANVTVEQGLKGHSVVRVSWVLTHADHLDISDFYNHSPSTFQWELATGTVPPTGGTSVIGTPQQNTYAATALGPYDQTTWGNNTLRSPQVGQTTTRLRLTISGSFIAVSLIRYRECFQSRLLPPEPRFTRTPIIPGFWAL